MVRSTPDGLFDNLFARMRCDRITDRVNAARRPALSALVTVAEMGSVTKAAGLLHLVHPAVTRQIRLLEEEIGVPLFDRTRQGMIPTAAGEVLVEHARRALHELERARTQIRPDPQEVTGIVTGGVTGLH